MYCQFSLRNFMFLNQLRHASRYPPRPQVDISTAIKYLNSDAYQKTYSDEPVWLHYRRNHKGQKAPQKTRRFCIIKGHLKTYNACPICRDPYLHICPENVRLLSQFIDEQTGEIFGWNHTGLCRVRHRQLRIAVHAARDCGLLPVEVPYRQYDYEEYMQ